MPTTTDQQLEQLKQKYQSVFDSIQQEQIRLTHVHIVDNKLFIQGDANSDQAKNRVWDRIKSVEPNWQNDLIADIRVSQNASGSQAASGSTQSGTQTAQKTYKVQSGDTLSKIAKQYYGNPNDYMKIFDANRDKLSDPNKIQVGQELTIP
jgi:nucleoid-associated protein YgaU